MLNAKDLNSDTWAKLAKYLATELEAGRTRLESHLMTADQTATVRGDIGRIRKLLALGEIQAPAEDATPQTGQRRRQAG